MIAGMPAGMKTVDGQPSACQAWLRLDQDHGETIVISIC